MRIGIGYDIHRLVAGRPLILGGVTIPYDKGLLGHSDGDALLHSIADALLGAAALGDIGRHFPDTDSRYKDADSAILLSKVVKLLSETGYAPVNVDANIVAEKPKLSPHIGAMRERISAILGLPMDAVSIKARTNEGVGPVGQSEAIVVQAAVLVKKGK
ncbi:MAG: 2-C-methyl-D-erythritol 2,4-cyclodiphosphate synthase [Pseudomonadota bacterium]